MLTLTWAIPANTYDYDYNSLWIRVSIEYFLNLGFETIGNNIVMYKTVFLGYKNKQKIL